MQRDISVKLKICRNLSGGEPRSLLSVLQENAVHLPAYCGGKGICGKCKVRFVSAPPSPTAGDLRFLNEEELQKGYRLACQTVYAGETETEVELELPETEKEEEIQAEADFFLPEISIDRFTDNNGNDSYSCLTDGIGDGTEKEIGSNRFRKSFPATCIRSGCKSLLAVDIGTTTLAASWLDPASGEILGTATAVNRQRSFGADVISRIDATNHGHGAELQALVQEDLASLCRKLGGVPEETEYIISGNTTMGHLLQGYPCQSLGVAPYTPVDISLHTYQNMRILPGISTFVGSDIVSGIIACGMDQAAEICLLVDLGTNGEMVLGNRDRMICASAAAGPAFEGGNILCGMASVPGAISAVEIQRETEQVRIAFQTIGGEEPLGLCGTGVLETVYELRRTGLLDETGLLDAAYFAEGFPLHGKIRFTNKDVREVQMAKAAIRAGVETLLQEYGTSYGEVSRIYLAGGFGRKIHVEKAVGIGLLPRDFLGKIIAVGNSSLAGAVLYAQTPALSERFRFQKVAENAREIPLAESAVFSDFYMKQMLFPPVTPI